MVGHPPPPQKKTPKDTTKDWKNSRLFQKRLAIWERKIYIFQPVSLQPLPLLFEDQATLFF